MQEKVHCGAKGKLEESKNARKLKRNSGGGMASCTEKM